MIPVNVSALGGMDAQSMIYLIQSDENLVGTASPVELVGFILAIIIAYIAGIFAAYYLKRHFSHRVKKEHLDFWIRVVRILFVLAAMAITVPPFFDAGLIIVFWILIGSLAVFALAGQKVIANAVAGVALMYERPFARGDFICVGETSGTVVSITLFATMVRTVRGVTVHIPNDQVYTTASSNYYSNAARRYDYEINIRYRDDSGRAVSIIKEALDRFTFVLKNPVPEVFVSDLAQSSVTIKIRAWFPSVWANTQDDVSSLTDLLPQLKTALERAGIEIPFPQRTVWFGNEMHPKK
ncbi:MAG: mechanosensitive ion channel family protein [Methanoregula sp.]|nr:MAG: mechanosensitive ion channel family protein [Methanoregula sp.]